MLRYLYVLSDPSPSVRQFVECVFAKILHQRNTKIFSENFLDAVCALSGWSGLQSFQGSLGNEEFSLQNAPSRRAQIYRFMLSLMTNEQKYNVCAQIVNRLLQAFIDSEEKIELPSDPREPAGQVLSDGLKLLWCKEMRICFSAGKAGQDEETPEGEKADVEAARGVLSSILKRNVWENIVPVLVHLKNLMEERRSPFLGQLRDCLREILRDFKDDLSSMLSGDPQLAAEIAHDLEEHAPEKPTMGTHIEGPTTKFASRRLSIGTMMHTPKSAKTVDGSPGSATVPRLRRSSAGEGDATPVRSMLSPARTPLQLMRSPELPVASSPKSSVEIDDDDIPRKRARGTESPASSVPSVGGS